MRGINRKNYTFKVYRKGEVVFRLSTHSIRRFLNHLRTINYPKDAEKVYLRVSYGRSPDVFGKVSTDYNDGYFENHQDLLSVFDAFNRLKLEGRR